MGLDLGLEAAGFKTKVALEINKQAIATIKLNRPRLPVISTPIEDVSTDEILAKARLKVGEPCLVTGGPCCQSFSTVGKRNSVADPRGGLFRHFIRIVQESRPRFFVMENVKGILSAAIKHRPLNDRGPCNPPLAPDEELGSALKLIRQELSQLNYYVVFGLLNCADYGVPQKRLRVVFIGSRDGEQIILPEPTHSKDGLDGKAPWVTLRDTVGRLRANFDHVPFTSDRVKLLRLLGEGENWSDLPKRFHQRALGEAYHSWGGRTGFCRRLAWDEPAPTLTTSPIGRATTLCHPTEVRPLTVREYARLQQFPQDWKFSGSAQQKYIQIGNAVPLGLGSAVGKALRKIIANTDSGKAKRKRSIRGIVECSPALERRLKNRAKTQLHPPHLLKDQDPEARRKWLTEIAA